MYDPLVVDTFLTAYPDIASSAALASEDTTTAAGVATVPNEFSRNPWRQIRVNATESALLEAFRRKLVLARTSTEAVTFAADCLRQLTAAVIYSFYRYDAKVDKLVCETRVGDPDGLLHNLTIRSRDQNYWLVGLHTTHFDQW